jgi:hypothetical protein
MAGIAIVAAATAAVVYAVPLYNKTPCHTSALSGEDWVQECKPGAYQDTIYGQLNTEQKTITYLILLPSSPRFYLYTFLNILSSQFPSS